MGREEKKKLSRLADFLSKVLRASPRSHRMWVVLSSTEEGRDSIDE